jgi:uncharacterized membrane protein YeaQ/YmgE (transglycosylase-associated protein family)
MFKILGFGDVTMLEAWTIMLAAVALSMIVGWVIDTIAEKVAFGVFGNAAVCIGALMVSLLIFRGHFGELSVTALPIIMGLATASVVFHIYSLIFLKRVLKL